MFGLRLQCRIGFFRLVAGNVEKITGKSCYDLMSSFRDVEAADGVFLSAVNRLWSICAFG